MRQLSTGTLLESDPGNQNHEMKDCNGKHPAIANGGKGSSSSTTIEKLALTGLRRYASAVPFQSSSCSNCETISSSLTR
ncbi:hypothetical protein POTOM_058942 [Populus tomentosa]|uniref:Uncharacterized protein n=1 Tax=Populus tomentosa TaxID=118781 RepID=A0A8X8C143_POPTO|nr:hypothetical protein POTOM_058942 [Populus tomentosa]